MRIFLFCVLTISLNSATAQTSSETSAERVVQVMLSRAADGTYTSWDATELNKLGDASAVGLTKIIAGKNLNVNEINQALLIITLSFNAPRMIENESDREPRTALFVLKYLENLRVPAETKKRIAATEVQIERAGPQQ